MKRCLLFILFLLLSNKGICCSCAEKPSVKKNWEYSTDVFIAQVLRVDTTALYSVYGHAIYIYQIKILQSFKNKTYKGYKLRSIYANPLSACAYTGFVPGEKYLIYTNPVTGIISDVSICSRTAPLNSISTAELNELKSLSDNRVPEIEMTVTINSDEYDALNIRADEADKMSYTITILYCTAGILLILLIVMILFFIRAKRWRPKKTNSAISSDPN